MKFLALQLIVITVFEVVDFPPALYVVDHYGKTEQNEQTSNEMIMKTTPSHVFCINKTFDNEAILNKSQL